MGGPSSWLSRAHSTTEVRRWTVLAPPGGGSGSAQRRPLQLRAGSAGLAGGRSEAEQAIRAAAEQIAHPSNFEKEP